MAAENGNENAVDVAGGRELLAVVGIDLFDGLRVVDDGDGNGVTGDFGAKQVGVNAGGVGQIVERAGKCIPELCQAGLFDMGNSFEGFGGSLHCSEAG